MYELQDHAITYEDVHCLKSKLQLILWKADPFCVFIDFFFFFLFCYSILMYKVQNKVVNYPQEICGPLGFKLLDNL